MLDKNRKSNYSSTPEGFLTFQSYLTFACIMRKFRNTDSIVSAEDWFASGDRVHFDPNHKRIVSKADANTVTVFEKVIKPTSMRKDSVRWITFLPGFPDGSYGFAKIERELNGASNTNMHIGDIGDNSPQLYIEYVGQGDSDTPKSYCYSTVERANLVEAQWRAKGVEQTVLVTFDYSSLVMLELLQRQKERVQGNGSAYPRIDHVLSVNGGYFVDGHSHPFTTTPLLKSPIGRLGSRMAQRSNLVVDQMLKPLWSKEYRARELTRQELRETVKAIRMHKGAAFMSAAAGFVDEHEQNSERWNLHDIYVDFCKDHGITFHIVGSAKDRFEHNQIQLVRERLAPYYPQVKTETIPGGHLSLSEQPSRIVEMKQSLVRRGTTDQAVRSWTTVDPATQSRPWSSMDQPPPQTRKYPWSTVRQ